MFKKDKFLTFIPLLSLTFGISIRAQEASFMPLELIAEPGESKTNNISSGQSESLRVGTTSSFGANVNVSSSSGYLTEASSSVETLTGSSFLSSFGGEADNPSAIKIDVGSLRQSGLGSHKTDIFSIDSTDSSLAEGDAEITGIFASSTIEIDPNQVTDVKIIPNSEKVASDSKNLQTANSSAGQSLTNSLNVDITNTEFQNAFSQAF